VKSGAAGTPGTGSERNSGTKWHRDGANLFPSFLCISTPTFLCVICSRMYAITHIWLEFSSSAHGISGQNMGHLLPACLIRMCDMCVICCISACLISMCVICSLHVCMHGQNVCHLLPAYCICLSPQNVCHLLFACEHFNVRHLPRAYTVCPSVQKRIICFQHLCSSCKEFRVIRGFSEVYQPCGIKLPRNFLFRIRLYKSNETSLVMQRREANAPHIFNRNFHRHQNQLATQKTGPILQLHCKKRLAVFPSPPGMSLTKLCLAEKN
jgi:hypothetical protein